ncbi:MAG: hypothetical protein M1837_001262 [Sclerophora amabilis]|nr:MAG: hypothetical protein M1837_001262 [Sclerophora amabilis]
MSQPRGGRRKGGRDRGASTVSRATSRGRAGFNGAQKSLEQNSSGKPLQKSTSPLQNGVSHHKKESSLFQPDRSNQSNGVFQTNRGKKPFSRDQSQESDDHTPQRSFGQAPKNSGDLTGYYNTLKKKREKEREHAIANDLVDDPNKQRRLEDAITFVGTCVDMCPEFERVERMVRQAVDGCEKVVGNDGALVPSQENMIKRFRRSAAGDEAQLPSDVRPPPILKKTLDYLINEVVGGPQPLAKVHAFVWDRTRSIRNDFTLQNMQGSRNPDLLVAVECYEIIARLHVHSLHQLSNPDIDDQGFTAHNEREQLNKTLLTLMELYDLCAFRQLKCVNEAEFRAYNIILHLQGQDVEREAMNLGRERPELYEHPRIQKALELYAAAGNVYDLHGPLKPFGSNTIAQNNFGKFFRLVKSGQISYTMACVAEIHFNHIRRNALMALRIGYRSPATREDCTMRHLMDMLGFDDEIQAQDFCEACGMRVSQSDAGESFLVLNSGSEDLQNPNATLKQPFSKTVIEHKRHGRALPDIIYGLTVRQARAAGKLPVKPTTGNTTSTNPFFGGSSIPQVSPFQSGGSISSNAVNPFSGFGVPSFTSPHSTPKQSSSERNATSEPDQKDSHRSWGSVGSTRETQQPAFSTNTTGEHGPPKVSPFNFASKSASQPIFTSQASSSLPPSQPRKKSSENASLFISENSDEEEDRELELPKPSPIFPTSQLSPPPPQLKPPSPVQLTPSTLQSTPAQAQANPFAPNLSSPGPETQQPQSNVLPQFYPTSTSLAETPKPPQQNDFQPRTSPFNTQAFPLQGSSTNPALPTTFQTTPTSQTSTFPTPVSQIPTSTSVEPPNDAQKTQPSFGRPKPMPDSGSRPPAVPRSILKQTKSRSPLRNEIQATPAVAESPPTKIPKDIPVPLVEWLLSGKGGLLDNLVDYVIPHIITAAQEDYEEEKAVDFRKRKVMERFFYKWRYTAQKRGIIRRGKKSRERMSILISEQRLKKRKSDSSLSADFEIPSSKRLMQEQDCVKNGSGRRGHQRSATVHDVGKFAKAAESSPREHVSTPQGSHLLGKRSRADSGKSFHRASFLSGNSILGPSVLSSARAAVSKVGVHDGIKSDYWRLKAAGLQTLPNGVTLPTSMASAVLKRKNMANGESVSEQSSKKPAKQRALSKINPFTVQRSPHPTGLNGESDPRVNGSNPFSPAPTKSTTTFDKEDEELFAKIRDLKQAMDDGIGFYREEVEKDEASGSPSWTRATDGCVGGDEEGFSHNLAGR